MNLPKNPKSALEVFLSLVQIPSPSKKEKIIIDEIASWLKARDIDSKTDQAFKITGSDTGNLIVERGTGTGEKILLLAHTDTVEEEGELIEPVVEGGVVKSRGDTILGADNKAAVAALLYLLNTPQKEDEADSIIVFTVSEEKGRMGAEALGDISDKISYAFPVDGSMPIGTFITKALGHQPFDVLIKGKRAHAAANPEDGVHAVQAASEIVSSLPLGRSPDFTINIGKIQGGSETNVIPEEAVIKGEIRGYSRQGMEKGLRIINDTLQRVAKTTGAEIKLLADSGIAAPPFSGNNNKDCIEIAKKATKAVGVPAKFQSSPATFEANFLDSFSLPTLGISSGGNRPHSNDESIEVSNLEKLPELLLEILRQGKTFQEK